MELAENGGLSRPSNLEGKEIDCGTGNKRRKITEPDRKRVSKACASCRRLKEECDGSIPCHRCVRYSRICGQSAASKPSTSNLQSHGIDADERETHLETIARHFLGSIALDIETLRNVTQRLEAQEHDPNQQATPEHDVHRCLDEQITLGPAKRPPKNQFAHSRFARQLHDEVKRRLMAFGIPPTDNVYPEDSWATVSLSNTTFGRAQLPPKEIAVFLSGVYFDYAQTGVVWVEQSWVESKIEHLYSRTVSLTPQDNVCICSVLTVLAIAVQFAHLASEHSNIVPSDASLGRDASAKFYKMAVELLPNAFLISSIDSVRALALLTHLALSWKDPRLAYRYIGAATRTASQIERGLFEQEMFISSDSSCSHDYNLSRVVHAWEKRISILNGFYSSIEGIPKILSPIVTSKAVASQHQITPEARAQLFVQMTSWLESTFQIISRLNSCHKSSLIDQLMRLREDYKKWWSEKDISRIPILQMNRHTGPLHICYHLNLIYMGRWLILYPPATTQTEASIEVRNGIAELVDEAEYAAYEIIDICSMLDGSVGLCVANYVEYSACRAAVLVMLAQSLVGRCCLFRGKLKEGLDLIRKIGETSGSHEAHMSVIETIAKDIENMAPHEKNQKYVTTCTSTVSGNDGYRSLRDWAAVSGATISSNGLEDEALIREDCDGMNSLDEILGGNILDTSWFTFDPSSPNELDQGLGLH